MRRSGVVLGAAFLALALSAPVLRRAARSWPTRVAVVGHSMDPTLRSGEWLLVDPAGRRPKVGQVVVVRDPRDVERLLVKRVVDTLPDGSLLVAGDHPAHRGETASIGPLGHERVIGRPWLRYWPLRRLGRIV